MAIDDDIRKGTSAVVQSIAGEMGSNEATVNDADADVGWFRVLSYRVLLGYAQLSYQPLDDQVSFQGHS
jgi:hypothetical protein